MSESEDTSMFHRDGVQQWELDKWMKGVHKEPMKSKGVLEQVDRGEYAGHKPVPSKLALRV